MFDNLSFRNIYSKFANAEIGTKVLFQLCSGDNVMNLKVKNRQKKALRNGNNNGRGNKRVTSEAIMKKRIFSLLENHGREILEAATDFYEVRGRGFVNVSLTNHPDVPYKTGKLYYVTEEDNKVIESCMPYKTENDVRISEGITTYEPTVQAVVCVWYDMMTYVTTITATFPVLDMVAENMSLTIH